MGGIAIAGTLVADVIKMIDHYPKKGALADICDIKYGIGGCAANTAVGVKKLDPSIEVKSIGLVGRDNMGEFLKTNLAKYGVDTSMIQEIPDEPTAFSDVMTVKETGERTFFHTRGASRRFDESSLCLETLDAKLVLIGYGGLLDALNTPDPDYDTALARAFADLKKKGIRTALDVATMKDQEEMQRLVVPALPYVDYVIVNEIEGGMIAGIEARDEKGVLQPEKMRQIGEKIVSLGTGCCVLHAPELGCAADRSGNYCEEHSLNLPEGYIVGAVGAGDSFCAGILYAMYRNLPLKEALKIGAASAAANLSAEDSVGGLRSIKETMELYEKYAFRE